MSPTRSLWLLAVVALCGCPGKSTSDDGGDLDASIDAGDVDAGPTWSTPIPIDTALGAGYDLSAAVDSQGHAAVAYFTQVSPPPPGLEDGGTDAGASDVDAGLPDRFRLMLARDNGMGTWTTEAIDIQDSNLPSTPLLTGHYGLALAFDSKGQPALAFLGGGNADLKAGGDGRWTSFIGPVADPLPSDAVIMRYDGSAWSTTVVAQFSNDIVATGYAVDDKGVVTGLWAGLAFDSMGNANAAFRDIHYGSDMSATSVSNLEYYQGDDTGNKLLGELIAGGRGDSEMLQGAGTYTRMVIANGQPAVSFALSPDTTDDSEEVWFAMRTGPDAGLTTDAGAASDGGSADTDGGCLIGGNAIGPDGGYESDGTASWAKVMISSHQGETDMPPSLAYSPKTGFVIVYYDGSLGGALRAATSPDGLCWTPNTLEALGNTGQYPAVAVDSTGQFGVLYALCSLPTDPQGSCSESQELRFRYGPDETVPEHVDSFVPASTALVVDGAGRFTAIYRDPSGGVYVSVRTP